MHPRLDTAARTAAVAEAEMMAVAVIWKNAKCSATTQGILSSSTINSRHITCRENIGWVLVEVAASKDWRVGVHYDVRRVVIVNRAVYI